jgi:membrane-associated phospholipid phosphatase
METVVWVQGIATPWLDSLMTLITDLGSEEAYVALLVITYLGIDPRAGRAIGVALMLSFMLNQLAKGLFDTPRPFELDPDLVRTERARAGALGPGFPSGHAQSSTTFWGMAALWAKRPWFTGVALLIIALVSFSRIYLGVHLPLDILGGLVLGGAVLAVAQVWLRSGWTPPAWALMLAGLVGPLALHLALPTPESDLLMGALAALIIGPMLIEHRTTGRWSGRLFVTLLGLVVAFGILTGTSLWLPEAIKRDPIGGFLRYFVLTMAVTALVPYLAQRFGWTRRRHGRG